MGGDQRLAAGLQNENELQARRHARLSQNLQGLSIERVMRTSNDHSFGKVLKTGSVSWCPSTRLTTEF